jgi:archaellum component FlaF (FlaF/FlaG flagellin family)
MNKFFFYTLAVAMVIVQSSFAQDYRAISLKYFQDHLERYQLTEQDVSGLQVSSSSYSESLNAQNVYVNQYHNGILVFNSVSSLVVRGDVVKSAKVRFVPNIARKINASTPSVPAISAISKAVSGLGIEAPSDLRLIETKGENSYLFNKGNISLENIPVTLVYQPINDGESYILAWDLSIYLLDGSHYYSLRIDAQTGEIIALDDWVVSCSFGEGHFHFPTESILVGKKDAPAMALNSNTPQYRVFPLPLIGPNEGRSELVTDPSDPIASLFGWHDVDGIPGHEYTYTRGNNVFAYDDITGNNIPGIYPDGGNDMLFDFPFGLPQAPGGFTEAAVVQLFYLNNKAHDIFYRYGFDEASGNFQFNNYGRGGAATDLVFAEAQDGGGMNNANFATGPDGVPGRMQMYLWSPPGLVLGTYLKVNNGSLAGSYYSEKAGFGPQLPTTPITADLVLVENSGTDPHDGCTPLTNAADLNGKIAVIRRGSCSFVNKVEVAQNAGALAVVVTNTESGDPIIMGGDGTNITIPSVMIYQSDGEAIIDALLNGDTINATIVDDGSGIDTNRRDGTLDNVIAIHEYGHGVSIRLTGGRNQANCLMNQEQMGEGWSDYLGLMLTMKPGDKGPDVRGIGTYANGEGKGGNGIRTYPYSTDFSVNPYTYNHIRSEMIPHGVGAVWGTMLWDMTWAFIDEYGYDPDIYEGNGGNNMALQLVMDGMKLQPCSPGFVDGRDAILDADLLANGGANKCLIWNAFAARGLGLSADQGSTNSRSDGIEAFDVPTECKLGVGAEDNIRNKFVVYPNPAQGEVHISTRFDVMDASVSIYDMNGRKMLQTNIQLQGENTINTSSLAPGIYLMNIEGGGLSQTTKLIVQ